MKKEINLLLPKFILEIKKLRNEKDINYDIQSKDLPPELQNYFRELTNEIDGSVISIIRHYGESSSLEAVILFKFLK